MKELSAITCLSWRVVRHTEQSPAPRNLASPIRPTNEVSSHRETGSLRELCRVFKWKGVKTTLLFETNKDKGKGKGKGLPQQAEEAQGVPGRLRPRIF